MKSNIKDQIYEEEKKKIIAKNLTAEEYERKIKMILEKLKY